MAAAAAVGSTWSRWGSAHSDTYGTTRSALGPPTRTPRVRLAAGASDPMTGECTYAIPRCVGPRRELVRVGRSHGGDVDPHGARGQVQPSEDDLAHGGRSEQGGEHDAGAGDGILRRWRLRTRHGRRGRPLGRGTVPDGDVMTRLEKVAREDPAHATEPQEGDPLTTLGCTHGVCLSSILRGTRSIRCSRSWQRSPRVSGPARRHPRQLVVGLQPLGFGRSQDAVCRPAGSTAVSRSHTESPRVPRGNIDRPEAQGWALCCVGCVRSGGGP